MLIVGYSGSYTKKEEEEKEEVCVHGRSQPVSHEKMALYQQQQQQQQQQGLVLIVGRRLSHVKQNK